MKFSLMVPSIPATGVDFVALYLDLELSVNATFGMYWSCSCFPAVDLLLLFLDLKTVLLYLVISMYASDKFSGNLSYPVVYDFSRSNNSDEYCYCHFPSKTLLLPVSPL